MCAHARIPAQRDQSGCATRSIPSPILRTIRDKVGLMHSSLTVFDRARQYFALRLQIELVRKRLQALPRKRCRAMRLTSSMKPLHLYCRQIGHATVGATRTLETSCKLVAPANTA